jgi:flagellar biosynthesis protein FlhF
VIVDLPGYNPLDEDQISELGGLLTEIPDRCLLLVASASQKETDLIQAAASFGVFGLDGLAVTKLDETATFGSIFNVAMKTGVPLTYFSSGKGADGSLEAASVDRLVRALFGKGRM